MNLNSYWRKRYEEYFMEPQIFIDIVKFRKVKVNINGEIRVPVFILLKLFNAKVRNKI